MPSLGLKSWSHGWQCDMWILTKPMKTRCFNSRWSIPRVSWKDCMLSNLKMSWYHKHCQNILCRTCCPCNARGVYDTLWVSFGFDGAKCRAFIKEASAYGNCWFLMHWLFIDWSRGGSRIAVSLRDAGMFNTIITITMTNHISDYHWYLYGKQ